MKFRLLLITMVLGISANAQTLTKIWSITEGIKTPESVLFDSNSNQIFVSNINGDASQKDGNGYISILDANGKMKKAEWVTGLNAPKGQAISNGNLYVADIDELVLISIKDAKITKRYKAEKAIFLNDVTIDDDGVVYVSDTRDKKIYALKNDKLEVWLNDDMLESVNGLWYEKGQLYIGTQQLLQADLKTKAIKVLYDDCGGIDGLEKLQDGNFIFSNWTGRIFITKGTKKIKLLDTVDKQNTADIDFVPGKNLVIVPTFLANSVEAYKLNP